MANKTFSQLLAELPVVTAFDSADFVIGYDSQTESAAKGNPAALPDQPVGGGIIPVTVIEASGASQALAFPASGDICYDITLTANCAITLTGGTASEYQTMTLILRNQGGFAPTLPASIKWQGGVAPVPNTLVGKIDKYILSTPDAGVTIFGSY